MSRIIQTNGISMHIEEQGEGPLVILCHGFPESAYSWRHQLPALAGAGFHAVAPDQRGYGKTDKPEPIDAYDIFQLTGDIVGLVDSLGEDSAVIVGHDWGAPVAMYCSLFRPDIFRACVLMSVPYGPRTPGDIPPTKLMKMIAGEQEMYIVYFQEPGKAEKNFEADVRRSMLGLLYSLAGDPPPEERWSFIFDKTDDISKTVTVPETLPAWLTEADLDHFTQEFTQSGFRGGLNWYRNIDRNWKSTPFLDGAKILQPSLFLAGEHDMVINMQRGSYDSLKVNMPNLTQNVLIPGAGHWVQQEKPAEVNKILIDFLKRF